MDPSRVDSRYNLNYSMSSIGLGLSDQADLYGNPAAVAALGGRPPSGGLMQPLGNASSVTGSGGSLVGLGNRSTAGLMQNNAQCQSLSNAQQMPGMQRGLKRSGSDCHDEQQQQQQHRNASMNAQQTMQSIDACNSQQQQHQQQQQQQQQQTTGNIIGGDAVDDSYNSMQNKKSPPANGKKTKGRVKIKMEYIDNKLRRYTTFSKRKTGIMKKAYELSTLTGTQVMLLVASETGHVYTFATRKLQPMITSEAGKQLIQTCLNSPDPPNVGSGDQRMSATGFEETELSYNIADEDSKDARSPMSTDNETDNSSDVDSPCPLLSNSRGNNNNANATDLSEIAEKPPKMLFKENNNAQAQQQSTKIETATTSTSTTADGTNQLKAEETATETANNNTSQTITKQENIIYSGGLNNIPTDMFMHLLQTGQLQLHSEQDGSGQRYVSIPLSANTLNLIKTTNKTAVPEQSTIADTAIKQEQD